MKFGYTIIYVSDVASSLTFSDYRVMNDYTLPKKYYDVLEPYTQALVDRLDSSGRDLAIEFEYQGFNDTIVLYY
jgi:hypothetical protein